MASFSPKDIFKDRRRLAVFIIAIALFFNIVLALLKYFIYLRTNLVGIWLDSISGFMDILYSVIALIAFKQLLNPKAKTSSHGYGRMEYVSTLIMALVIIGVGVLYFGSSINRYPFPSSVYFTWKNLVLLITAAVVKIGFGVLFTLTNKRVRSGIFKVFALVSYLSGGMTLLTSVSYLISNSYSIGMDAVVTTFESLFYLSVGFLIALDSTRSLVGRDPSAALKYEILKIVKSNKRVESIGNMILHDYGLDRTEGTLEVEYDYEFADDIYYTNKELEEEILNETGVKIRLIAISKLNEEKEG